MEGELVLSEVITRILFILTALIYTLIIAIIFFRKKKVRTIENIIYGTILNVLLVQLCINITNFFIANPFWSQATKKAYNVCFVLWGCLLTLFFFIVSSKENQGLVDFKDNLKIDYYKKIMKIFGFTTVALCALVVILLLVVG